LLVLNEHGLVGAIQSASDVENNKLLASPDVFDYFHRPSYRSELTPTLWVITRGGTLLHKFIGSVDEISLRAAILEAVSWPPDKEAPRPIIIE